MSASVGEDPSHQHQRRVISLDSLPDHDDLANRRSNGFGSSCLRSSVQLEISRSMSELSELLRSAGHAQERAAAEHSEQLLTMQREITALREQLTARGITALDADSWQAGGNTAHERGLEVLALDSSDVRLDMAESANNGTSGSRASGSRYVVAMEQPQEYSDARSITIVESRSHRSTTENLFPLSLPTYESRASTNSTFATKTATDMMNPELNLRTPWTVHQEMASLSKYMMAKSGGGMQEHEDQPERRTMRETLQMATNKIKANANVTKRIRHLTCSSMIATPGANWRLCWDLSGACLIGYDVIMIPFDLAFMPKENAFLIFMDWLTMLFWTMDMVFTFFVGYISRGRLVMSPAAIAKRYLITWFLLDAVVVAGDWFNNVGSASSGGSGSVSGLGKLVRSLRAIRVLRLLRLLKLRRMMAELQDHISSEYTYLLLSLTKLLLFILFLNHGIACLWYWVGRRAAEQTRPSWVTKNEIQDRELGYKYTTSLHWTLTQFTPASMEVMPQNTEERTMSVIVLMFALVAFSSFVGSISTSMTALRNMNADTNKQFWMLRRFLKQQNVTKPVGRRILKYLEYIIEKKQGKVQQAAIRILNMLSGQLQEELSYELTSKHLMNGAFFQYYLGFPHMDVTVRKVCSVAMKKVTFATADVLFYTGDEASQVYCFVGGDIDIVADETVVDPPVEELEWIAEIALWTPWKHMSMCQANYESDIITVSINKFVEECNKSVISWSLAAKYGKKFLETLEELDVPPGDLMRHSEVKDAMQIFANTERQKYFQTSLSSSQTALDIYAAGQRSTRTHDPE